MKRRYNFIKGIKNCCEKDEFFGVSRTIVPILSSLIDDRDNYIRAIVLDQLEYITKVHTAPSVHP